MNTSRLLMNVAAHKMARRADGWASLSRPRRNMGPLCLRGWATESARQNRRSWNSDIHLENSWRARARWERWERGIIRDEQLSAVAVPRPECDVGRFVQGIARREHLDTTRRVDTDDLVYGVGGNVEVVCVVHGPSVGAPQVARGTAENARRAGTAVRVYRNAHDFANISVRNEHVAVLVEKDSIRTDRPHPRRHRGAHNAARSRGSGAF